MNSTKRMFGILAVLCLLLGNIGIVPGASSITDQPTAKAATKYTRYIKTCTAEVYATTGPAATVVKTLKRNKKVTQYGAAKDGWAKISYASGETGFVQSKKLSKKKISLRKAAEEEHDWLIDISEKYGWGELCTDVHSDFKVGSVFRASFLNGNYYISGWAVVVKNSGWIHYDLTIETYATAKRIAKKKGITATAVAKLLKKYRYSF